MHSKYYRLETLTILLCAILFVLCFSTSLTSCSTVQSTAHGEENVVYLQIAGNIKTYETVQVIVDDLEPFEASVNDNTKRATQYKYTYKIATGEHDIKVLYNGELLKSAKVFASANQVKIIEL